MNIITMYPPQKDSPSTFLMGDISTTDTLITVSSAAILPQTFPYPLTLGVDKPITEVVMVTSIDPPSNQITIVRGDGALSWYAGTKVARVFNADDLQAVQSNLENVITQSNNNADDILELDSNLDSLTSVVGDSSNGLIKELNDEIARATTAESTETSRATSAESALDSNKINRSELPQIITDATNSSATATALTTTYTRYNASTQATSTFDRTTPLVTTSTVGLMTPEAYNEISSLRSDITALQQQGGLFIGVTFNTKADLDAYTIPSTTNVGDFTYILDDETHSDATTRYIYDGTSFVFGFIVNYDPVGIATSTTAGVVKSDSGVTDGKVFVETDGTMSVVGWDDISPSPYYGTSSSAAADDAKVVTTNNPDSFKLISGSQVIVNPTVTSTVAASTLNVNGTGDLPMRYRNAAITTSTGSIVWQANYPTLWVTDGTYWHFVSNSYLHTYSAMSITNANTGTSTTENTISPKVLTDEISAYAMYGTCATAAGTVEKAVTVVTPAPADLISLKAGMEITVQFTYANTASSPTLNVDSLGAKPIFFNGSALVLNDSWAAGQYIRFKYDGTNWNIISSDKISTSTPTSISGILKGDGSNIGSATVSTNTYGLSNTGNYISALTQTSTASGDGGAHTPAGSVNGTSLLYVIGYALYFGGVVGSSEYIITGYLLSGSIISNTSGTTVEDFVTMLNTMNMPANGQYKVALTAYNDTYNVGLDVHAILYNSTNLYFRCSLGSRLQFTLSGTTLNIGKATPYGINDIVFPRTTTGITWNINNYGTIYTAYTHNHTFTGTAVGNHTHTYDRTTGTSTAFSKQTVITGVS